MESSLIASPEIAPIASDEFCHSLVRSQTRDGADINRCNKIAGEASMAILHWPS